MNGLVCVGNEGLCTHLCTYLGVSRVGQNRMYTPYMTIYFGISLPNIPYIHCIGMVLANPRYFMTCPFVLPVCACVRERVRVRVRAHTMLTTSIDVRTCNHSRLTNCFVTSCLYACV